jgi:hypothetical protein
MKAVKSPGNGNTKKISGFARDFCFNSLANDGSDFPVYQLESMPAISPAR